MPHLKEKVALVTGGSRGIGAAIARRLAHEGAKVIVNFAANRDAASGVVEAIRKAGGDAKPIQADVSDLAAIKHLVGDAMAAYGKLDILVNNAGVYERNFLGETSPDQYERIFSVNVRAPLFLSAEVARHLKDGGRIVNISSGASTASRPGGAVYAASKAALEAMTRVHAAELGERGITVNAVAPGITVTDMAMSGLPEDLRNRLLDATPLHRLGKPEDIADVVAFLASDDARWVTGQVISASGGLSMR